MTAIVPDIIVKLLPFVILTDAIMSAIMIIIYTIYTTLVLSGWKRQIKTSLSPPLLIIRVPVR